MSVKNSSQIEKGLMSDETKKIEFIRTIGPGEVRSHHLNLTDEFGTTFGQEFPPHEPIRTPLAIIDGKGRRTNAKKHNGSQIWGSGLGRWFLDNSVTPGTRIKDRYDAKERSTPDCLHVVHLDVIGVAPATAIPKPTTPQIELEEESTNSISEMPLSLERQLEDFLAVNLNMLEKGLQLYREDGDEGRQYPTEVGIIDLLCVRQNNELLVVELKRGRSSDVVVGQISRYMGWVARHIANGRVVKGLILTYEQDDELRYAVAANPNIELKRFKLRLEIIPDEEL